MICLKAFNEQLNGPKDFKARSGWLKNFKNRHGIKELDIQGEKFFYANGPGSDREVHS